ncbi:MAG: polysaccharide deacetylase [Holosporales bacterium]
MDSLALKMLFALRPVPLWWRDDDAARDTPELRRLLELSARLKIPLLLAVIPDAMDESLPPLVRRYPLVRVAQHGVAHTNHAPASRKKQELVSGFDAEQLRRGKQRLEAAFPEQFRPILVPPWNRIDAGIIDALPGLGYAALSAGGGAARFEPLLTIDGHVDPVAWGTGKSGMLNPFRGHVRTTAMLLRAYLRGWRPIGLLTHHLGMDEAAWRYSERLLERLRRHFVDPDALFACAPAPDLLAEQTAKKSGIL